MNRWPACVFEVNEIGNKEFSWSGLRTDVRRQLLWVRLDPRHDH